MKSTLWVFLAAVFLSYWLLVTTLGFPGFVAYGVQFWRIAVSVAVLIIYIPAIATIFREVPPPGRDYLLAGIILTWLSSVSFSVWNELGRVFGTEIFDGRIYTGPVAGFFSLLLVTGGVFHLLAPSTARKTTRLIAMGVGGFVATAFVLIAPYFR